MHSKSDKIEITINDKADKIINKRFNSPKNRYQNYFELIKGPEFVFDYVHSFYYKCHNVNGSRFCRR